MRQMIQPDSPRVINYDPLQSPSVRDIPQTPNDAVYSPDAVSRVSQRTVEPVSADEPSADNEPDTNQNTDNKNRK